MKILLQLFILISLVITRPNTGFTQSVFVWDDPIVVADGSIYGNTRPRITLNKNQEPVVVFGNISTKALHSVRFNGTDFNPPILLSPNGFESYLSYWTGPEIDASGDTILIVFKEAPIESGHIYSVRSTDGGQSYSEIYRTDSHDEGVAWLPNLAFNTNGNPSIIYMVHDQVWSDPRYVVSHSFDGGVTFNAEQEVSNTIPEEACDCCPAAYAQQDNHHALLFRNNEANVRDMYAVSSDDNGESFPNYENIDQLFWTANSCPSTGPDTFIDQEHLFTVSASRASGKYRCYVHKKDLLSASTSDGGFMLPAPENGNDNANYPRIHGTYDSLFTVWQASDNSNFEIYCAFGTANDFDLFEQTKTQVNINTEGSQTNPDLFYSHGYVHMVFQDGASGNVLYRKGRLGNLGLVSPSNTYLNIYPNPCSEFIKIAGNAQGNTYSIHSIKGSLITDNEEYIENKKIDVSQLSRGSYILSIGGQDLPFEIRK